MAKGHSSYKSELLCECGRGSRDCFKCDRQETDSSQTLNVNSPVVNHVLIARGLLQKRGKSQYCSTKVIKYVKDVSCVDQLCFVQNVRNVQIIAPELPVRAKLHQF